MADLADLIPIDGDGGAVETYKRSRSYLEGLIKQGAISKAKVPGDIRTYLLRSELDAYLHTITVTRAPASEDRAG